MKNRPLYTAAQWQWVAERYLQGYTMRDLARFLGVHHNTVAFHLQKLEVDRMLVPLEERKREFVDLGKVVNEPPQNNYFMNRFTEVK